MPEPERSEILTEESDLAGSTSDEDRFTGELSFTVLPDRWQPDRCGSGLLVVEPTGPSYKGAEYRRSLLEVDVGGDLSQIVA